MPDPTETPTVPVLTQPAPAVSPTGEAIIPPVVVKWIIPIVALTGGIALAPQFGVDVSFLPPMLVKVCALVAFLGNLAGIASPGARKSGT